MSKNERFPLRRSSPPRTLRSHCIMSRMPFARRFLVVVLIFGFGPSAAELHGADRPTFPVPPTLEIEVLDPAADPLGNPAVTLRESWRPDRLEVDIPPTVLVHRYYYTGDRSFQAQILPGGPSIVVASHPKTGERCYIPVQMLPGAPRVTYTAKAIEYDYGGQAIIVDFHHTQQPSVRYRNGTPWPEKIGKVVHAEKWRQHAHSLRDHSHQIAQTSGEMVKEAYIDTADMLEGLTLPIHNIARLMPLGNALFDPDRAEIRAAKIAEYDRRKAIERAERVADRDDVTIRTNR